MFQIYAWRRFGDHELAKTRHSVDANNALLTSAELTKEIVLDRDPYDMVLRDLGTAWILGEEESPMALQLHRVTMQWLMFCTEE
jgi:hypothetical protein